MGPRATGKMSAGRPPVFLTAFERSPMSYAASPIFFIMALVTYFQMPGLCSAPGSFGYLSSMWLMYVIMGAVHVSPWFQLAWEPLKSALQRRQEPERQT